MFVFKEFVFFILTFNLSIYSIDKVTFFYNTFLNTSLLRGTNNLRYNHFIYIK